MIRTIVLRIRTEGTEIVMVTMGDIEKNFLFCEIHFSLFCFKSQFCSPCADSWLLKSPPEEAIPPVNCRLHTIIYEIYLKLRSAFLCLTRILWSIKLWNWKTLELYSSIILLAFNWLVITWLLFNKTSGFWNCMYVKLASL